MNLANTMNIKSGYLELFVGPMFSGKSTRLISIFNKYKLCEMNPLFINHNNDLERSTTRLGGKCSKSCSTFDNIAVTCNYTNSCAEIIALKEYADCTAIFINEGQFFEDIYTGVLQMIEDNKHVYICGLDGDFSKNVFSMDMLKLVPHCDNVTKLKSICGLCKNGSHAIFTKRMNDNINKICIGDGDIYMPVCRKCYI